MSTGSERQVSWFDELSHDETGQQFDELQEFSCDDSQEFLRRDQFLSNRSKKIDFLDSIPVVNPMPTRRTIPRRNTIATKTQVAPQIVQPPAPTVALNIHFMTQYNTYVANIMPQEATPVGFGPSQEESSEESPTGQTRDVDPFGSLSGKKMDPRKSSALVVDNAMRGKKRKGHERHSSSSSSESEEDGPGASAGVMRTLQQSLERDASARIGMNITPINDHRTECFLCSWGNKFHDGIKAKHMIKLYEIWNDYGVCSDEELAEALSEYYMRRIYNPRRRMPSMTMTMTYVHIQTHTLAAEVFVGKTLRACQANEFLLQNQIWRSDGTYNREALHDWERMVKLERMMRLTPLAKMSFNMGKTDEDLKKLGKPFNLSLICAQEEEKRHRAKKKKRLLQSPEAGFFM